MRRLFVVLAAIGTLLGSANPAVADETRGRIAIDRPGRVQREITIHATWGPKPAAVAGWGFVRVRLLSDDDAPHDVRVDAGDWDGTVRASRSVRLKKGEEPVLWLPVLPTSGSVVRVTTGAGSDVLQIGRPDAPLSVLVVGTRAGTRTSTITESVEEALRGAVLPGGGASFTFCSVADVPVDGLPSTWTQLSAASLVVLDGSAKGLEDAERQRTLLRYARAGGFVWVRGVSTLPAGPLATEVLALGVPSEGVRSGRIGFGGWAASGATPGEGVSADVVRAWFAPSRSTTLEDLPGALSPELGVAESVPGIGRVDVRLYFVILVAFAILVGPVAYFVLKRRRRLVAMLWVVPATGIAFATGILGYGLLSEGLSTRGVVTSISYLDQGTHEATCVASRTLYAGFSPGRLRLSPDTVLHAPGMLSRSAFRWPVHGGSGSSYYRSTVYFRGYGGRAQERLLFDVESGTFSGSILPSRTPTPFATATCTRARERLRFKARADGVYDVLSAEGFAPVAEADAIVFRDAKGDLFVGAGPAGPLRRATEAQADAVIERLRELTAERPAQDSDPDPREDFYFGNTGEEDAKDRARWAGRALGESSGVPAKNGYVARMTRAPGFDDLGVDVDWKRSRHVVVGVLAPDDVE